jgi:hypothetical protein
MVRAPSATRRGQALRSVLASSFLLSLQVSHNQECPRLLRRVQARQTRSMRPSGRRRADHDVTSVRPVRYRRGDPRAGGIPP